MEGVEEAPYRLVTAKRKGDKAEQVEPKKYVQTPYSVPTENRYTPLDNEPAQNITQNITRTSRVPPIIVDTPMALVESLLASCTMHVGLGNFTAKILNRTGRVRINPRTKEHHDTLMANLAKTHQFHTFTDECARDYCAVVLGLYEMDPETIKKGITEAGIKDIKAVVRRNTKASTVLYVARFPKGTTSIKELQEKCGKLCHCIVTWQQFSPAVKEYIQCRNCQQFGHAASNCRRIHKCIKCLSDHTKGSCPRTTREGTAKCVNCRGDHAANYKGCAAYLQYKASRQAQAPRTVLKQMYTPAPPPTINFWETRTATQLSSKPHTDAFPALENPKKPVAEAEKIPPTETPTAQNPFAELQKLQAELLAINNIWDIIAEYKKIILAIKSATTPQQAALALISANFN